MAIAVAGLTTESMGAAITGMSNVYASIVQLTDTSWGSRVRRLGTIAMSSKAYARLARLARPISMSLTRRAYRPRVDGFVAPATNSPPQIDRGRRVGFRGGERRRRRRVVRPRPPTGAQAAGDARCRSR